MAHEAGKGRGRNMETTRSLPVAGELYRHFKGNLYQVIGIAHDAGTMEQMVVYWALYGERRMYVRGLAEFLSPVDKEKYPDAAAQYRFERVSAQELSAGGGEPSRAETGTVRQVPETKAAVEMREIRGDGGVVPQTLLRERNVPAPVWDNPEAGKVRTELLRFLDATTPSEKLMVLREIRGKMDEELMTSIELSIDLMPDERETLERRLSLVEKNLEKRVRYEGGRLR